MTDTSFSEVERESRDEAAEAEVGVEFGEDEEVACLRKRAGAVTVVSSVVVITCSMVDVTVEAWNCVAVAGPWVRYIGVNAGEKKAMKSGADRKSNLSADSEMPDGRLDVLIHWPCRPRALGRPA